MQGRAYLDLARDNLAGSTEAHWRGALGRAYYALMLECREALFRWGFSVPPRENIHTFVRLRFNYPAHAQLKVIGKALDTLGRLRSQADYDLTPLKVFASPTRARQAILEVTDGLTLLDTINADPARQAAAVAAIRAAFP